MIKHCRENLLILQVVFRKPQTAKMQGVCTVDSIHTPHDRYQNVIYTNHSVQTSVVVLSTRYSVLLKGVCNERRVTRDFNGCMCIWPSYFVPW